MGDALVSSLAKFTYLTSFKEMRQKNLDCISALLAVGVSEGDYLGHSWQYVLHCISQLERLQLRSTRALQDFQFFTNVTVIETSGAPSGQVSKHRAHGTGISAMISISAENSKIDLINADAVVARIKEA